MTVTAMNRRIAEIDWRIAMGAATEALREERRVLACRLKRLSADQTKPVKGVF